MMVRVFAATVALLLFLSLTISTSSAEDLTPDLKAGLSNLTSIEAPLMIKANNKTRQYGDENPVLDGTVTGVTNGDRISGSYGVDADKTSPVGTYTISATALDPDDKLGNYDLQVEHGTLTVEPRKLTVTVPDMTWRGGQIDSVSYQVMGLMEWDAEEISVMIFFHAMPYSAPGTYKIEAELRGPLGRLANYDLEINTGRLTITEEPPLAPESSASSTAAKVTVTVNNATWTYGAKHPAFTVQADGLPTGEKLHLAFRTAANEKSDFGTYPITVTATPANRSANFTVEVIPGTLTVEPAPLTVTPHDVTRSQGTENPPLTGTITGLQNGDPISVTFTTTATSSSAPGTYPIKATLVDPKGRLANYNVTLREGVLTVESPALRFVCMAKLVAAGLIRWLLLAPCQC